MSIWTRCEEHRWRDNGGAKRTIVVVRRKIQFGCLNDAIDILCKRIMFTMSLNSLFVLCNVLCSMDRFGLSPSLSSAFPSSFPLILFSISFSLSLGLCVHVSQCSFAKLNGIIIIIIEITPYFIMVICALPIKLTKPIFIANRILKFIR